MMMFNGKLTATCLLALLAFPSIDAAANTDVAKATQDVAAKQISEWNSLLSRFVKGDGGVDYAGLNEHFSTLEKHVVAYGTMDPTALDDQSRKAAYINLYNAGMMYNVLKYTRAKGLIPGSDAFRGLQINAIRVDGGNIWNGDYRLPLGGKILNLDEIEHGLLRRQGNKTLTKWMVAALDPRIHAAVNCAAMSCPRVRETAYTADNVDKMLDENFYDYLSNSHQFKKAGDAKMHANSIVFWYYDDFDSHAKESLRLSGAGDYLSRFVRADAPDAAWKIEHLKKNFNNRSKLALKLSSAFAFEYDWRINDMTNVKNSK